ncbi:EAL domain-containing protein [Kineococcus radiotolerans]|uniref:sensor domain-containing phosphodiesterase n=1 Tax=Kineococcus radiotolerans TaxID=131568 RepID=UPI0002F211B4|nr:EAL domain-containing protein [Kineococcus radiotolerans]
MPAAPLHPREGERLASLRSYRVLDTGADAALDALAAATARLLDAPTATISLVDEDRQWFASTRDLSAVLGYETPQTSRDVSFCAWTVAQERTLVVPDARTDARFADNAMVTGPEQVRAYAGAPIIGRDGLPLGALCVMDREARDFAEADVQALSALATSVAELLELRRLDAAAGLGSRHVLDESHALRAGIDAQELVVHYQPVVDLPTGRWEGVEALVRWEHPQRGLLAPAAFLPVAEASGLIVPLGRQVLTLACTQVALWRDTPPTGGGAGGGARDLHVAVNLSGRQLGEPDVVDVITDALLVSGLPAQALTLELTETSLAGTGAQVDAALAAIRARGVRLALDDFGTGYASYAYLQRFQPDVVKIDRCFVAALGRSERDDLLTSSLIGLGLQLGCGVVAEGVETPEQARMLADLGVTTAQGYLFSPPRTAQALGARLVAP